MRKHFWDTQIPCTRHMSKYYSSVTTKQRKRLRWTPINLKLSEHQNKLSTLCVRPLIPNSAKKTRSIQSRQEPFRWRRVKTLYWPLIKARGWWGPEATWRPFHSGCPLPVTYGRSYFISD